MEISETLTFVKSPDSICLPLPTADDCIYEKDEMLKAQLTASEPHISIISPYATVTIKDNDKGLSSYNNACSDLVYS